MESADQPARNYLWLTYPVPLKLTEHSINGVAEYHGWLSAVETTIPADGLELEGLEQLMLLPRDKRLNVWPGGYEFFIADAFYELRLLEGWSLQAVAELELAAAEDRERSS